MELIRAGDTIKLLNTGITSEQLLFPDNSRSERITITRVTLVPGARNLAHRHAASEQVWIALRGKGALLLDAGATLSFAEGDVVRFAENELHGFENTGTSDFEYLSVTSPPVNFRGAYKQSTDK
jgi:quercetin dioxygenase-like cupin family protein